MACNPSVLWYVLALIILAVAVTDLSPAFGMGSICTSYLKKLGKKLCLCFAEIAMDIVCSYTGCLWLGRLACFALGSYWIGQGQMYARTKVVVVRALSIGPIPQHFKNSPKPTAPRSSGSSKARTFRPSGPSTIRCPA